MEQETYYVTMDSDTVLAPNALEEGLLPFANPKVTSVAALVIAKNATTNLVTRLTDLHFVNFQVINRSSLSKMKSVLVNSGGMALYRAQVVRDAIPVYEAETFAGRTVMFSDDSMLTLHAYMKGESVQQPTAVAYTMLPEKVSHHLRQQLRWFRGSTIRSVWRAKYLPLNSYAFWAHATQWLGFGLTSVVLAYLLLYRPVVDGAIAPWLLVISALVIYATSLKYLTLQRPGIRFRWQLATFAMAPLVLVWTAFVLRPLRFYGILTCWKTGSWGTRQAGVEVELKAAA